MEAKNEGGILSSVLRRYLTDNNLLVLLPFLISSYKRRGGKKGGATVKRLIEDPSITLKSFTFLMYEVLEVSNIKVILKIPKKTEDGKIKEEVYERDLKDLKHKKIDARLNFISEINPEDLLDYLVRGKISWKNFIRRIADITDTFTIGFIIERNNAIWDYELSIKINKTKRRRKRDATDKRDSKTKTGNSRDNTTSDGSDGKSRDEESPVSTKGD